MAANRFKALRAAQVLLRSLFRLIDDRCGNIGVMTAILIVPVVGALGMATEASGWFLINRAEQSAADSAALAAASNNDAATGGTACNSKGGGTGYVFEARAVASKYGFTNGSNNTTVNVTYECLASAPSCVSTKCYVVTITHNMPLYLSNIVGYTGNVALGSGRGQSIQAVSAAIAIGSGDCALALDPSGPGVTVTGGTTFQNCGLQVNSSNTDALDASGGSFTASAINVVGGYHGTLSPAPTTGQTAIADPYTALYSENDVSSLTNQSCPFANRGLNINTSATLSPGVYCNSLNISNGTVNLSPGVYIIQGGQFSVSGGTVTGSQVTIILTCASPPCTSSSTNWATAALTAGSAYLTAPPNGDWAGTLFYQDPADTSHNDTSSLTGVSNSLTGVMYFPGQTLDVTGGAAGASCNQIVAYDINFTGGNFSSAGCKNAGVTPIGASLMALVL